MRKISKISLMALAGVSCLGLALPSTAHAITMNKVMAHPIKSSQIVLHINLHHLRHAQHQNIRNAHVTNIKNDGISKSDLNYMNLFADMRAPERYRSIGGNTRDLGNYVLPGGKYKIKPGRIIRSADLNGISRKGLRKLKKLHVHYIDDLRDTGGKSGIGAKPDPNELNVGTMHHTGFHYVINPVYTTREHHQFGSTLAYYGNPAVTNSRAIRSYKNTFKLLLRNHHGAVLYHCSLGRDRTGTTSALILAALGANQSTIYHDYLLTDHYCYHYGKIRHKPYSQQAAELNKFFNTIDQHYGSVNNYLHNALGLSNAKISQLKANYLTRA